MLRFFDEYAELVAIAALLVFMFLLFGGIIVGATLSEQGQNELAKVCIEAGKQWIDGSCVAK